MISRDTAITSTFEDHTGAMWVGINYSLTRREGQRFVPLINRVPRGIVASLAEDRAFNLWAVSFGPPRQILKIDPARLHVAPVPNLPPASRVAADPAGGIYVVALNGDLIHVDALGGQVAYPHPAGHSGRIPQLSVARDGTVYASTSFGLEVLRNGKIHVLDTNNGLPCKVLYDSIFDRYDNLWLYTQCGAVRIARADLARWLRDPAVVIPVLLLDAGDGAIPFDAAFGGSARKPDGVLWFSNASSPSLQKIDPDSAARRRNPPPVHLIEQFTADGKHYDIDVPIKLPPLAGDIEIDYTGLSFVAPDRVQFRYKLDPDSIGVGRMLGLTPPSLLHDAAAGQLSLPCDCKQQQRCMEQFRCRPQFRVGAGVLSDGVVQAAMRHGHPRVALADPPECESDGWRMR